MGKARVREPDCTRFLQWALPRLGLRWKGFRRVRRQVCRRVRRRSAELGLESLDDYRWLLDDSPEEWRALDRLCRVTISRFLRDREVFRRLGEDVLPELAARAMARGRTRLQAWSVGCASGEEAYSLSLTWRLGVVERLPRMELRILATDVDVTVLARARRGSYQASSLREVAATWRGRAFERSGELYRLRDDFRDGVSFVACDVRAEPPSAAFDLILCRNLVFTYLTEPEQLRVGGRLVDLLVRGGALVVGSHETLPPSLRDDGLESTIPCIHRR